MNNSYWEMSFMSTSDRKIGFYNFVFKYPWKKDFFFNKEEFVGLLEYITAMPDDQKLVRREDENKAISLDQCDFEECTSVEEQIALQEGAAALEEEDIHDDEHKSIYGAKILFKSCKYNHKADLMSSIDGSERESNKKIFEGEKEKTHVYILFEDVEAKVILEERKNGISIGALVRYLNKWLEVYLKSKSHDKKGIYKLHYGAIPSSSFLDNLKNMHSITLAEIYTHKKILGSEALNMLNREDTGMKDEIKMELRAHRKGSLLKSNLSALYESIVGEEKKISRIRVYGKIDNMPIKLDSDFIRKYEYINTELDINGIVDTEDIFQKMKNIVGDV